jgi:putative ABC transport system permease protein
MKSKLLQILYDMRHQPVIAWVTVLGTALSIFLILVVVMMQQVGLINYAPESHRDRMLYGLWLHIVSTDERNMNSSGGLDAKRCAQLYNCLEGVEETAFFTRFLDDIDVHGETRETASVKSRMCDDRFWKVFEYPLLSGRYFNAEEVAADAKVLVINESTARRMFGTADAAGKILRYNHNPYKVVGVVADASPLAFMAYGEVFAPLSPKDESLSWSENFGEWSAAMLVKPGVDFEYVRDQVKKRYAELDTDLAPSNLKTVYHGAPFDQETVAIVMDAGSNTTPDTTTSKAIRWILYALLLIVPAINLSSMLHSRMRRRISEIGVRRAYGCTRARIVADILVENLLVTLAGGVIGLVGAISFALCYDGLFDVGYTTVRPALGMILNVYTIAAALVACLVLNIISASIPAWQAARVNPVDAINSNRN